MAGRNGVCFQVFRTVSVERIEFDVLVAEDVRIRSDASFVVVKKGTDFV